MSAVLLDFLACLVLGLVVLAGFTCIVDFAIGHTFWGVFLLVSIPINILTARSLFRSAKKARR